MATTTDAGVEALNRLKEIDPPSLLAPNPALSQTARTASQYLFSSLRPFSQKSPLDQLLVDGYDAEQIWHQIDIQSQPLLSTLRRRLKQLVNNPEEISKLKAPSDVANKAEPKNNQDEWEEEESDGFDEELDEGDEDVDEDEEGVEKEEGKGEEEGNEDEDEEDEESAEEDEEEKGEGVGIEDKFFKINELNAFLKKEEVDKGEQDSEDDDMLDEVKLLLFA